MQPELISNSPFGAMVARRPPKAKAAGSIPVMGVMHQRVNLFLLLFCSKLF